jgi:RNA-directed DNA polymerase
MSTLALLKAADSLHSVGSLLKFKPKSLAYLLYIKPPADRYRSFQIPKRSGGLRDILSPADELKLLQRRVSQLLQDCISDANIENAWNDKYVHGFTRDRSIISNAELHRNRRFVFNLDLEDFFGTINFGRVRGFFLKNRTFQLHPKVATVLAQIACHNNLLPQGSPCSPVISNLVGHILDVRLCRLASSTGCTYTRYADDITFSTNREPFPAEIGKRTENIASKWVVGDGVIRAIAETGFRVNSAKTRMQFRRSRQDVTGLIVNRIVNTKSEYRGTVRVMAHRLFQTGKFEVNDLRRDATGALVRAKREGTMNQLRGMLAHIYRVDSSRSVPQTDQQTGGAPIHIHGTSRDALYRRFLLFQEFYCAVEPTILCEGKTDPVYLRFAIKKRLAAFPQLAVAKNGGAELRVRLFRYSESHLSELMGVEGGFGALCKFIGQYLNSFKSFKTAITAQPIILVVDHDSGGRAVFNAARDFNKTIRNFEGEYTWIAANLYLVCTPFNGDAESVIEHGFTRATRDVRLNGKTFSPDSDFDTQSHYGKVAFARHVEQNWQGIDFTGFDTLLTRLEAVLTAHRAKLVAAGRQTP